MTKCELVGGPMDGAVFNIDAHKNEFYMEKPVYPAAMYKPVDKVLRNDHSIKYERTSPRTFKYVPNQTFSGNFPTPEP